MPVRLFHLINGKVQQFQKHMYYCLISQQYLFFFWELTGFTKVHFIYAWFPEEDLS